MWLSNCHIDHARILCLNVARVCMHVKSCSHVTYARTCSLVQRCQGLAFECASLLTWRVHNIHGAMGVGVGIYVTLWDGNTAETRPQVAFFAALPLSIWRCTSHMVRFSDLRQPNLVRFPRGASETCASGSPGCHQHGAHARRVFLLIFLSISL